MRNKTAIIVLTLIITALCLYTLSYTYVAWQIGKDATEFATNEKGIIDYGKKSHYEDSLSEQPVYNFLGNELTYKQVKEKELGLGLDLQGGMHVTLEVSPIEILIALSANSADPSFARAIQMAKKKQVVE